MVVPFPQKGDIFINDMEQKNILHQETKERYERELQRKNELNSMISVPIAFISVLVGCLGYFFSHIPDNSNFFLSFLFYLFLLVSIAGVVICFIFVYRHQTGYKYEYVSDPAVLHDYMEKFANQLKEQDVEPTDEVLNAEIEDVLFEQQLEATSKNIKCNDQKVFCYRHLIIFIMITMVSLSLTFLIRMGLDDKPADVVRIQSETPIKVQADSLVKVLSESPVKVSLEDSVWVRQVEPIQCEVKHGAKTEDAGKRPAKKSRKGK